MQEYIKDLEKKYKKIILKRYLKIFLILIIIFFCFFGLYLFYLNFKEKEQILICANKEKQILEQRLNQAKIQNEKNKILKNKAEKQQEKNNINIISNQINIQKLKKDFYFSPNYEKALFLSKIYFNNKDYKKSIFWSLKANELDKNKDGSWILFIKANEKLGYKEQANKALNAYLDIYGVYSE